MAGKVHKVVALDEGYLVVNAPLSEFPEKGYFTMYDQSAVPKGLPLRTTGCSTWHRLCTGAMLEAQRRGRTSNRLHARWDHIVKILRRGCTHRIQDSFLPQVH